MSARVKCIRVGRRSLYVGISRFHELRITRSRGYFEVHIGRVYAGWVTVPAPMLTPEQHAEVVRFGIHPELGEVADGSS